MKFLAGKKVYLSSLALFLTGGAAAAGWITKEQSEHIYAMLTALIAMAFRSAMASNADRSSIERAELLDTIAPGKP